MTIVSSTVFIDRMRLHAFHGVAEQERVVGNDFEVSLRVHYNISKAMASDNVADALNYATLNNIVKEQMAVPSCLLEHVGGRICQEVLSRFPEAEKVQLRITKLNPPMGIDSCGAGVELEVRSDE